MHLCYYVHDAWLRLLVAALLSIVPINCASADSQFPTNTLSLTTPVVADLRPHIGPAGLSTAQAQPDGDALDQAEVQPPTEQPLAAATRALILYDAPAVAYGKLGLLYAIMLRNLLGHFSLQVDLAAVETYTPGRVENYDATFYIGSYFDNVLPTAFLQDVMSTQCTVVWMRYNLWRLAWDPTYAFTARFGIAFDGVAGFNSPPSVDNPAPGFFDMVQYKDLPFHKYYVYDSGIQTALADPDVGLIRITDSQLAQSVVPIFDSTNTVPRSTPYIVRAANLWYIADIPFSFINARDRYVVFSDVLHDILDSAHEENHPAMVRLEDVSAMVDLAAMQQLTDYLYLRQIPFSVAVIPLFRDPFGVYNNGQPQEITLGAASDLLQALAYATARGGRVVMHGYTHQYDAVRNPYTAVSGDDFEFWDARSNAPIAEDARAAWLRNRINRGLADFAAVGLTSFAWETPHYQGSPRTFAAVRTRFTTRYERSFYYTARVPRLNLPPTDPARDFAGGQFFPFVVLKDHYGQRVIPENLGNIEYDISGADPISNVNYRWEELLTNARYARVVRDGVASFFFHPFWVEQTLGLPALSDFKNLVEGITALGYTWTDPTLLADPTPPATTP